MPAPRYSPARSGSGGTILDRNLDSIAEVLGFLADRIDWDRNFLEDVAMTTGSTNKVLHKLGRKPRGFLVINPNAAATVHNDTAVTDTTTLGLVVSANVTSSLFVF